MGSGIVVVVAMVAALVVALPVAGNYSMAVNGARGVGNVVLGDTTRAKERARDVRCLAGKEVKETAQMSAEWAKGKIQDAATSVCDAANSGMDIIHQLFSGAEEYITDKARETKGKAYDQTHMVGESSYKARDKAEDTVPRWEKTVAAEGKKVGRGPENLSLTVAKKAKGGGGTKRKATDTLHSAKENGHVVMGSPHDEDL